MSSLQLQFHANVLEESRVLQEICLLQREFFLQLQIHANVLEEVECCKNVSSCNMSSSYCSNISMDNALEESAIQFVLQEYLLQRNVFIPCLQDGESLYHFLPWSNSTPNSHSLNCTLLHHFSCMEWLKSFCWAADWSMPSSLAQATRSPIRHYPSSQNGPTRRTADPQTRVSLDLYASPTTTRTHRRPGIFLLAIIHKRNEPNLAKRKTVK